MPSVISIVKISMRVLALYVLYGALEYLSARDFGNFFFSLGMAMCYLMSSTNRVLYLWSKRNVSISELMKDEKVCRGPVWFFAANMITYFVIIIGVTMKSLS
ncbi:hypothetical protein [Massilia sp. BJB1822]|uniref:hypothetical protein n=1 Tax=Massilia sp. BJB1822 TaxID=2744470 RepID=UPI0015937EF1|nr:hypothetical protein [Massilia sp. BJB1822]NVD98856.1 hypothetical protein [Massilia sp. BJB1822]